jgi:hypothetical protein
MSPEMSTVLARVSELGIKIELRDKRTVYLDGRPCQTIKSKWYENFPNCRAMSLYMPRQGFADFLLYVPEGHNTVYVVPRGKIAHDTAWAESGLEPYKEAWQLLKETTPLLFERKIEPLSIQLRKIIAEADKHNLKYELICTKRSKRKNDYRNYMQRRILIQDKRCAIFTASLLPESTHMWPTAIFKAAKDRWSEISLYILGDDVYVVPRSQITHDTTIDLESSRIYDYKNSWCVLSAMRPMRPRKSRATRLGVAA